MSDLPAAAADMILVDVSEDPLKKFTGGESLHFKKQIFPLSENAPRFAEVRPLGSVGVCLALIFEDGAEIQRATSHRYVYSGFL